MGKLHRVLLCLLSPGLVLAGCHKAEINTQYIIVPQVQTENQGEIVSAQDVTAYAYYGDTLNWTVASWDDAVAGRITNRLTGDVRTPDVTAEPGEDGELSLGPLTQLDFAVLVCLTDPDEAGKMYAWRKAATGENLELIRVKVIFRPWKATASYVESRWTIFNGSISPEPGGTD